MQTTLRRSKRVQLVKSLRRTFANHPSDKPLDRVQVDTRNKKSYKVSSTLFNGLLHSTLDFSGENEENPLYDYAQWCESKHVKLKTTIAFEDYNHENGMGYGLQAGEHLDKGTILFEVPLISTLNGRRFYSEFKGEEGPKIFEKTYQVAQETTDGSKPMVNKMVEQMLNAHMHIHYNRLGDDSLNTAYLKALPVMEMAMPPFWDKDTLVQIDSKNLQDEYRKVSSTHNFIAKQFTEWDVTNYGREEWIWAFHTVGSRFCILNNSEECYTTDPNFNQFVCPLAEYLNHSFDPNVELLITKSSTFYSDMPQQKRSELLSENPNIKGDERIDIVQCKAIKNIPIGQQLCINYGNLSNMHFLQKFGFTVKNNPNAKIPYDPVMSLDRSLMTEESELKDKLYKKLKIPPITNLFHFYENKFDANILKSLRIAFLTMDIVANRTFEHIWNKEKFLQPISSTQEEIILNYVINHLDSYYQPLKDKNYEEMRDSLGDIDSLQKFNLFNIYNIQVEEQRILAKNLRYLNQLKEDCLRERQMKSISE